MDDRALRKEIGNLEKQIAKLDTRKKELNDQLMTSTDAMSAMQLHEEMVKITEELEAAELRWAELQEQMENQY